MYNIWDTIPRQIQRKENTLENNHLDNQLLWISINLTLSLKTSHSCLTKWHTRFFRHIPKRFFPGNFTGPSGMAGAIMVLTVKLLELSIPPSEWMVCPRKKGTTSHKEICIFHPSIFTDNMLCYIFPVGITLFSNRFRLTRVTITTWWFVSMVSPATSKPIDARCPGESSALFKQMENMFFLQLPTMRRFSFLWILCGFTSQLEKQMNHQLEHFDPLMVYLPTCRLCMEQRMLSSIRPMWMPIRLQLKPFGRSRRLSNKARGVSPKKERRQTSHT